MIEAVRGQYKWGSGLTKYATLRTAYEKMPGQNQMGKVHMQVRQRLLDEYENREDGFALPKNPIPKEKATLHDIETEIENRYNEIFPNDDDLEADNVMCKGRGIGRGDLILEKSQNVESAIPGKARGRGKRSRGSSSSSEGSHHPPLKHTKTTETSPKGSNNPTTISKISSSCTQQPLISGWCNKTLGPLKEQFADATLNIETTV